MKNFRNFVLLYFILLAMIPPAANATPTPVVAELFTSQNCSSCPGADKILGELASRPNIIALACHITYFDSMQWKDTLSQDFCTKRQSEYAQAMGRANHVYTPQMIVNGTAQLNGAEGTSVIAALSNTPAITPISIARNPDNSLSINLPGLPAANNTARILIFGYQKHHYQQIASGENAGRGVFYANAASSLDEIPVPWNGTPETITFRIKTAPLADGYAVLAQDSVTGHIIAAGKIEQ